MPGYTYSLIDSLSTPGGTISFNDDSGDTWYVDPERSTGLQMRKVRSTTYDYAQQSGYYFGSFFLEGRHIVLGGVALVRSATTDPSIVSARESMIAAAVAALESISSGGGTGTLAFTGASSLSVKCDLELVMSGSYLKNFTMGLVSAS